VLFAFWLLCFGDGTKKAPSWVMVSCCYWAGVGCSWYGGLGLVFASGISGCFRLWSCWF
jgi:hypothetical protein